MSESNDKIEITLLKADADVQNELKQFAASMRTGGIEFSTRARTRDSVGVEAIILAFIIKVGPEIAKALRELLVEWMKGRNGRRVRLRVGEVEAEASSIEELSAILKRVERLRKLAQK